ncbi:unnamed protein product, partial [Tuber aestivum]
PSPPPPTVHPLGEMIYPQVTAPESCTSRSSRDRKGEGNSGGSTWPEGRGEKGPDGGATDTPDKKGVPGATGEFQPEDIGADIDRTRNPLSSETKEHRAVRLQLEEIGGVGMEEKESPAKRGTSAQGDEISEALEVSDQKGRKGKAVEAETGAGEQVGVEEVLDLSGGVMGAPKAGEEDIKSSARVSSQAENTGGGDFGPSPHQLPETKETSPDVMACEPRSSSLKSADIRRNSGTVKGHDRDIDSKKHDKPQPKRVSFAPEPSESSAPEISATTAETEELEEIADVPGEFGNNIGTFGGHDREIGGKQDGEPAEPRLQPAQTPGKSSMIEELWKIVDIPQRPGPNPETEELEGIADVVGEFGYNIGTIRGHDRAIDNRCRDKPRQSNAHPPAVLTSEGHLPDMEAQRTPESHGLGNVAVEGGELGYNEGQLSFGPGRRETHGADIRGQRAVTGSGESAGISGGQRSSNNGTATRASPSQNTNRTAESQELSSITIESGEFGYNIGGLPSSHPDGHKVRRRHSSGQTQGREGVAPEAEELGRITIESGEFGYNVGGLPSSHPGRHRRHTHEGLRDRPGREASGSRSLGQIEPGNGGLGHGIGYLEHCQRGGEKETPTAPGSRHRNKQPASGSTAANDTPQSYYHNFISKSSGRSISPPRPAHAAEAIEPGNTTTRSGHRSQTATSHGPHTIPANPNKEESMGRMAVWGVIWAGFIIALGLVALWGLGHPVTGFGYRKVVGWSDVVAEWLFEEGKKGSS